MTIRAIVALCALLALSACLLMSRVPLVEKPAEVVGLADGLYQSYVMVDPDKPRRIPRRVRSKCIMPGYLYRIPAEDGRPERLVRPTYCPYDVEAKRVVPPFRVVREGDGYRFSGGSLFSGLVAAVAVPPDNHPEGNLLHFERVRGLIYLVQGDASDENERFEYYLARVVIGGLDFTPLSCGDFPSLQPATVNVEDAVPDNLAQANDSIDSSDGDNGAVVSEAAHCEAPSRAAIQPELNAVIDKMDAGQQPVMLLLRRVDTATGGAVASPSR